VDSVITKRDSPVDMCSLDDFTSEHQLIRTELLRLLKRQNLAYVTRWRSWLLHYATIWKVAGSVHWNFS